LPEALVDQVYERAGGVPLFVEEFTKMVQESGVPDNEWASSASGQTLLGREIPATLQDLMMARLDRMEGERELAQLAATLGREFTHELLAAVAGLDEATLEGELAKLVQAEILYAKGRPPRCSYIFKHALLEDALYNALVKGKRQQFHRRIAEVLEEQFPQTAETRPELLAHHFSEAGLAEKGVGYWLKAGLRSRDRSAEVEAIGHLNRGLMLLETLDASPARDVLELDLLRPLGSAYMASRGYGAPGVGPVFARACELSERVGQPVQVFASMYGNWAFHFVRGDLWRSTDLASEALEFARQHGDPEIIMEALKMRGQTMLYRADFARAHDHVAMAVDQYDDPERTKYWEAYTSQDPAVANRCHLAVCLWHLGFPDQALRIIVEMLRLARAIGHPFSLAYALHHASWLNLGCRLGAEVTATAEEQIVISSEQGFSLWQASGMFFKGAGLLQQGRLQEALPLVLNGLHAFQATGAELMLTYQFSALGEAYTKAGRFDDARQALDDGLALAEKNDECCYEVELHRLLGELHLAEKDDQAAAEQCFRTAIQTARRQQSKAWELRATMSLARLWLRQGRRDEARDALTAVYATYTEGFTTPDLIDVRALLETLS